MQHDLLAEVPSRLPDGLESFGSDKAQVFIGERTLEPRDSTHGTRIVFPERQNFAPALDRRVEASQLLLGQLGEALEQLATRRRFLAALKLADQSFAQIFPPPLRLKQARQRLQRR